MKKEGSIMFVLVDAFNSNGEHHILSRHRTLEALLRANRRIQNKVKKANGPTSYLPTCAMAEEGGVVRNLDVYETDELYSLSDI